MVCRGKGRSLAWLISGFGSWLDAHAIYSVRDLEGGSAQEAMLSWDLYTVSLRGCLWDNQMEGGQEQVSYRERLENHPCGHNNYISYSRILLLQQLTLGYFLCAWLCSKKFMHIDWFNLHSNSMKLLLLLSSSCAWGNVRAGWCAQGRGQRGSKPRQCDLSPVLFAPPGMSPIITGGMEHIPSPEGECGTRKEVKEDLAF